MPRPQKPRWIDREIHSVAMIPVETVRHGLPAVHLSADEIEALRLCDHLQLHQSDAAERMQVSRPTLGRILQKARAKVSEALITRKAIVLSEFTSDPPMGRGRKGRGRGHGGWYRHLHKDSND